VETVRGFTADRGLDLSASLAFATLLMAVPLAATFSLLLATFFRENDRAVLDIVGILLPSRSSQAIENVHEFIESARAVSGIGLLLLIATSLRLIFIIENTVNVVWGAPKRTAYLARLAVYTMALFVGALLIFVFFTGFQQLKRQILFQSLLSSALFGRFLSTLVVAAGLTLLYKFLPNARVAWGHAAIGGVTAALALRIIRIGFAVYFSLFQQVNIIYGSISLLFLSLIFLFLFWVLVLVGVELTFVLATAPAAGVKAAEGRIERAVRVLLTVAAGPPPIRSEDILRSVASSPAELEALLAQLCGAGLLNREPSRGYTLAGTLPEIPLWKVAFAVSPGLLDVTRETGDRVSRILRRLFRKLATEQRAMLDITLAQLAGRK
jgi:membrane protein